MGGEKTREETRGEKRRGEERRGEERRGEERGGEERRGYKKTGGGNKNLKLTRGISTAPPCAFGLL